MEAQLVYGWRAKIGLLVPVTNTTMESEFHKLAPDGVAIVTARMSILQDVEPGLHEFDYESAVERLKAAEPDLIVFGCTIGSLLKGVGYDQDIIKRIEKRTKIRTTTTSTAVLEALEEMKITKVALATPYPDPLHKREMVFLKGHGFDIVSMKNLGLNSKQIRENPPFVAYRLAREVDIPDAEGVFISCTAFRTIEIIEKLELDLQKPVVTSNQATLWEALKMVKIHEPIKGYGKLLTTL
jgi:maleate isomerase